MEPSDRQKDLISRATMAALAIAIGIVATKILVVTFSVLKVAYSRPDGESVDHALYWIATKIVIVLCVFLYIVAIVVFCFVFSARDKARSDPGRAMERLDKVTNYFGKFVEAVFRSK